MKGKKYMETNQLIKNGVEVWFLCWF